jgi:hypothetical protein
MVSTGIIVVAHRLRTRSLPLIWYCPVAVIMFSIVQHQNTLWGFKFAWYLVLLALTVTLALLDRPNLTWWLLVLAMGAAVIGSFSSLQGLLIWPAGLIVLYLRRRPAVYCVAWIGIAVLTAAMYFYNYVAPAGENGYAIRHPVASAKFFLLMVGDLVGVNVSQTNATGIAVILLGLAVVLVSVWALIFYCRRDTAVGGSPIAAALICFGLLFAALVTEGRIMLGLAGASVSRYRTFDLLIVVGLYLLVLDQVDLRRRRASPAPGATTLPAPETATVPDVHLDPISPAGAPESSPPDGRRRTAAVVLATFVTTLVCLLVAVGLPEGLAGARADHAAQLQAARVTVNIEKYPNSFVNISLSEFLSAQFLRRMDQVAMTHHLSLFATGDAADYRAMGLIVDPSTPTTKIALPPDGSVLNGSPLLSATATDYFGVSKVEFEASGQGLHERVISDGQPYPYGWLGKWRTTSVPNGRYTLEAVAFNAAGRSARSAAVDVIVDNH